MACQIYRRTGEAKESDHTCTLLFGMIVQLTNAKIILFDLMAYSTFVLPYSSRLSDLFAVTALLEIAGPGANLVYLFAGAKLHEFYNRYSKQTNTVMALLLAACGHTYCWVNNKQKNENQRHRPFRNNYCRPTGLP